MKETLLPYNKWKEQNYCSHGDYYVEFGPSNDKYRFNENEILKLYGDYKLGVYNNNKYFGMLKRVKMGFECSIFDAYKYKLSVDYRTYDKLRNLENFSEEIRGTNNNQARGIFANVHDVPYCSVRVVRDKHYDIYKLNEPDKLFPVVSELKYDHELYGHFLWLFGIKEENLDGTYREVYGDFIIQFNKESRPDIMKILFDNDLVENNVIKSALQSNYKYRLTEKGFVIYQALFRSFNPQSLKYFIDKYKKYYKTN